MAGKLMRNKFPAYCADESCGAYLPPGSLVRYYGKHGIYGVHCHTKTESIQGANSRYMEEKLKAREKKDQILMEVE